MCRSNCLPTSWSCPPPVDDRCVHRAGERVRREEHVATAWWLLSRARGPRTDWSLRALSLPPHPSPTRRYCRGPTHARALSYMHTHDVHMLPSMVHGHVSLRLDWSADLLTKIGLKIRNENCKTLGLKRTWLMQCSCRITSAVNAIRWIKKIVVWLVITNWLSNIFSDEPEIRSPICKNAWKLFTPPARAGQYDLLVCWHHLTMPL